MPSAWLTGRPPPDHCREICRAQPALGALPRAPNRSAIDRRVAFKAQGAPCGSSAPVPVSMGLAGNPNPLFTLSFGQKPELPRPWFLAPGRAKFLNEIKAPGCGSERLAGRTRQPLYNGPASAAWRP
jgi:hypothetical protein